MKNREAVLKMAKSLSPLEVEVEILKLLQGGGTEGKGLTDDTIKQKLGDKIEASKLSLGQLLECLKKQKLVRIKKRYYPPAAHFSLTKAGQDVLEEVESAKLDWSEIRQKTSQLEEHFEAIEAFGKTIAEAKREKFIHKIQMSIIFKQIRKMLPHGLWMLCTRTCIRSMSHSWITRHIRLANCAKLHNFDPNQLTDEQLEKIQESWRKICGTKRKPKPKPKPVENNHKPDDGYRTYLLDGLRRSKVDLLRQGAWSEDDPDKFIWGLIDNAYEKLEEEYWEWCELQEREQQWQEQRAWEEDVRKCVAEDPEFHDQLKEGELCPQCGLQG